MNAPTDARIATMLRDFESAWAGRDAAQLGVLFTADADYIDFAGELLHSRNNIVTAHAEVFAGPLAQSEFRFTRWQEAAIGSDVVLGHAQWELTGQLLLDGRTAAPRHGIITFVLLSQADAADGAPNLVIRAGQNTESLASPFGRPE